MTEKESRNFVAAFGTILRISNCFQRNFDASIGTILSIVTVFKEESRDLTVIYLFHKVA
jgi:hypothetical protein